MYWLIKLFVWNVQRRGLIRYWLTGHSYRLIGGFKARRRGIWDREIRDGVPFEGSVFKECLKTAVKGKLHSWRGFVRMKTWNRLSDLMELCKED